jgi:hypothetical protein
MVVPRAAARRADGRLTVWASTQNAQLTRGYREPARSGGLHADDGGVGFSMVGYLLYNTVNAV